MVPVAVLRKGFRPFFLGAAVFGVFAVPMWVLSFAGHGSGIGLFPPMYWHAHEMIFGFTLAVIAGFLLTAASNWTGRETLIGHPLAALAAVWAAARVLLALPTNGTPWHCAATLLDLSFTPLLAVAIARPILGAKSTRNVGFLAVLLGLFLANLLMHLGAWGVLADGLLLGWKLGLDSTLVVIVIVTGRVVPMFTRNATKNEQIRSLPTLERASIAAMLLVVARDLLPVPPSLAALAPVVAGTLVLLRTRHWGFASSFHQPLLWVLHLGHLWLPLGLFLEATSLWGGDWAATWVHALTVGSIGMLTLGMMVRVTLGHTGRMLAPPRSAVVAFVAIGCAALLRVAGPALFPSQVMSWLCLSGVLWSGAFVAFLVGCAPMLLSPRVDQRPG